MAVYEIVRVLDDKCLLDAESYQRNYATRDARVLTPGFYVVMWPADSVGLEFDKDAQYVGPFKLALHAKLKPAQYLEECETRRPLPRAARLGQAMGTAS